MSTSLGCLAMLAISAISAPACGPEGVAEVSDIAEVSDVAEVAEVAEVSEVSEVAEVADDTERAANLLGVGDFVSIEALNPPGHYVRHQYSLGELSTVNSPLARADATFKLTPGLANNSCVSFEASNYPNHYLRHQNGRIKLHPWSNQALYQHDATFCMRPALQPGLGPPWISFESFNYPGYYIRHRDYHLYIESQGGPFREDATFRLVNPV